MTTKEFSEKRIWTHERTNSFAIPEIVSLAVNDVVIRDVPRCPFLLLIGPSGHGNCVGILCGDSVWRFSLAPNSSRIEPHRKMLGGCKGSVTCRWSSAIS